MEKCPCCRVALQIVHLRQYLPEQEADGWVFCCKQCGRYFAAPTDKQVRQLTKRNARVLPTLS